MPTPQDISCSCSCSCSKQWSYKRFIEYEYEYEYEHEHDYEDIWKSTTCFLSQFLRFKVLISAMPTTKFQS